MGLTYAPLTLTNTFRQVSIDVRALVDTDAMFLCVPEAVAIQLGFDLSEASRTTVTVADSRRISVPKIAPLKIQFKNRDYTTEAFVLGDEPRLGVIPIEAMDCVVDPKNQELVVNPEHPNFPVFPVK